MKSFKRYSSLFIRRNYLWILIIFLIGLSVTALNSKGSIKSKTSRLEIATKRLEWLADNKDLDRDSINIQKINQKIWGRDEKWALTDEEINSLEKYDKSYIKINNERFTELLNYYELPIDTFLGYDSRYEEVIRGHKYEILSDYLFFVRGDFIDNTQPNILEDTIDVSKELAGVKISILFCIVGITFFLTSLENITYYSEFLRMIPWSKTKNYLMKIIFGLLIIIGLGILSHEFSYFAWTGSKLSNLISTEGVSLELLKTFSVYIGVFLISLSLGELAGNILGHVGLLIIGFTGIELLQMNLLATLGVFVDIGSNHPIFRFENWMYMQNQALRILYNPTSVLNSDLRVEGALTFLALSLVFSGLGIYFVNKTKSERTGLLVKHKYISKYVFFLAVITSANLLYTIFSSFTSSGDILGILIYFLSLLGSFLFYKVLFNSRIGL